MARSTHTPQDAPSTLKVSRPLSPEHARGSQVHHSSWGCKGGRLVLTSPALDAALPKRVFAPAPPVPFRYDDSNGRIIVEFEHDPAFTGGTVWRTQIFDLTALPRRRPRTLLDGEDGSTSAFRVPLSLLGVPPFPAHGPTAAGTDVTFNQRKDEVEERDRSKDAEANDDPARNCAHG